MIFKFFWYLSTINSIFCTFLLVHFFGFSLKTIFFLIISSSFIWFNLRKRSVDRNYLYILVLVNLILICSIFLILKNINIILELRQNEINFEINKIKNMNNLIEKNTSELSHQKE